jgi:hypothetical protein
VGWRPFVYQGIDLVVIIGINLHGDFVDLPGKLSGEARLLLWTPSVDCPQK